MLTRTPLGDAISVVQINPSTGVPEESAADYYSIGYTLNSAGDITYQSESNGTQSRTRSWVYSVDGLGNTIATPSAWAYS